MSGEARICRDDRRRDDVRRTAGLHGLDFLEVSDDQLILTVTFLGKAPAGLKRENLRVDGGTRIRGIRVVNLRIVRQEDPEFDDTMLVTVDRPGDFSTYTLRVVALDEHGPTDRPPEGFDPRYAAVTFSFKAGCPSDLDCAKSPPCPAPPLAEPDIDYLSKDYASFRQLVLDRLALIMPDWRERHVPDLGVALVELLAYVGDNLSYYQDAVATEAYLGTARQRISVRRHARLVDYPMHEGCNARTWVHVHVEAGRYVLDPASGYYFVTGFPGAPSGRNVLASDELRNVPAGTYEPFEPLLPEGPVTLYRTHNEIRFYTWGDRECCLPRGTTRATLVDAWVAPQSPPVIWRPSSPPGSPPTAARALDGLRAGDFVIFEEVLGPKTGQAADADPTHRHVVKLTRVERDVDTLYTLEGAQPQPIVRIEWDPADALPFPLCLSATSDPPECAYHDPVSVARGNVILVDHGQTTEEPLGPVPTETTVAQCATDCEPAETTQVAGRFRPRLARWPVTFRQLPVLDCPASTLLRQDPRLALPAITLAGSPPPQSGGPATTWTPRRDLLDSGPSDLHFVVEIDDDERAHLRFGAHGLGRTPDAGMTFRARYRTGHSLAGNVGAESILYLVSADAARSGIAMSPRNPLPARGGTAPEPVAEVKLLAPFTFRARLERAITADDYVRLAERDHPAIRRAAAALRWTGSWYEVLVALAPAGAEDAAADLLLSATRCLAPYRRIGHDLIVEPARYVPLEVALIVCVKPHYLRGHVEAELLDVLSNRTLPDGRRGFFHPDNLSFGEGVYVSALVAAVQAVAGVESVTVTTFNRLFEAPNHEIELGVLRLGPLEIARLDNDPSFPEHGRLKLDMRGGR